MKKYVTKVLQKLADFITLFAKESKSDREFDYWFRLAVVLNGWSTYYDIYLD